INGVGNNLVAPKQNTTREQAIVMMSRIAKNNGWMDEFRKPTKPEKIPASSDEYNYQDGFAIPKDYRNVYAEVAGPGKAYYLHVRVACDMSDVDKQKELLIGLLDSKPSMINKSGKDYVLKQFKDMYLEHPTKKDLHGWSSPESDPNTDSPMNYTHNMGNGYIIEIRGENDLCFEVIEKK
ncbi:hypothetical protein, partial [Tepidibacter sp. Z1-5]|uniref:hypothetical protein n=1 Tax=Tepidibacter sp. Z1-5 TaxID=3134138 RepID=UPI0030BF4B73